VLVYWNMNVIVDIFDLWHLHCLRNLHDHRHLSLLLHRYLHDLIHVLNLWHLLCDLLHFWNVDILLHNLGHVSDVILDNGFFFFG